ncbi:hypothetical protein D3C87_1260740 [compost metagenome]
MIVAVIYKFIGFTIQELHSIIQRPNPQSSCSVFKYFPDTIIRKTMRNFAMVPILNKLLSIITIKSPEISSNPKFIISVYIEARNDITRKSITLISLQICCKSLFYSIEIK